MLDKFDITVICVVPSYLGTVEYKYKTQMFFDKLSYHQRDLIITVDRDLVQTVHNRFKGKKVPKTVMIDNWIDEKEIYSVEANHPKVMAFKEKYGLQEKFVIMYSGNIGLHYDFENLMKVIEDVKPELRPQMVEK